MTDQITTITMTPDQMLAYESGRKQGRKEGYLIGFMASGEGWNGEYPYEGMDPEKERCWCECRDRALEAQP